MKPTLMSSKDYIEYRGYIRNSPCPYKCGGTCTGIEGCAYNGRCSIKDKYDGKDVFARA